MKTRELDNLSLQRMKDDDTEGEEWERIPLTQAKVTLRVEADFTEMKDVTRFYFEDQEVFKQVGNEHRVAFKMDHFCGCRFGLFCYSSETIGGTAAFSNFRYQ